ncbi:hypothetical protein BU16DRAFT_452547, partial [Lophium mytilinum]
LWCIIDHRVYNLTNFADAHPGGSIVLEQAAGTNATATFYNPHRQAILQKPRASRHQRAGRRDARGHCAAARRPLPRALRGAAIAAA